MFGTWQQWLYLIYQRVWGEGVNRVSADKNKRYSCGQCSWIQWGWRNGLPRLFSIPLRWVKPTHFKSWDDSWSLLLRPVVELVTKLLHPVSSTFSPPSSWWQPTLLVRSGANLINPFVLLLLHASDDSHALLAKSGRSSDLPIPIPIFRLYRPIFFMNFNT
jgi:hypothetical protein